MKKSILSICMLISFGGLYAEAFKIHENRASFGVGFGWKNKEVLSNSLHLPALNAWIERSVIPLEDVGFIAIGAQFGFHYGQHKGKIPLSDAAYKQSWNNIYFIPRAAVYFHELFYEYDFPENIDWYAGIGLGFNALAHRISGYSGLSNSSGFKLGYTIFVGGRYYFKNNAAVFAEFGYGLSYLNLGMTIGY